VTSLLKRYRWPLAAAGLAATIVVLVWFQPQALLFDNVVDEELPGLATDTAADDLTQDADGDPSLPVDDGADAASDEADEDPVTDDDGTSAAGPTGDEHEEADEAAIGGAESAPPAGPIELASGTFGSLGRYTTTGTARIIELEDGARYLRLEGFETTNGPDLFVYLSTGAADGSTGFTADFVDLGELRGNIGDQNYAIPDDVEVAAFPTVVIWCERFSSPFGAAALMAA
jgi:hypothetical protein